MSSAKTLPALHRSVGLNQYLLSPKFPEEFSSPELAAHSGKVECEPSVPLRAPEHSPWCVWPASPLKGQTAMQGAESTPSEGVSCQLAMYSLFLASADDSLPGHLCFCFAGPRFVCISCWFVLLFAVTARGLSIFSCPHFHLQWLAFRAANKALL